MLFEKASFNSGGITITPRGCQKAPCSGEQGSKDYSANVGKNQGNSGSNC